MFMNRMPTDGLVSADPLSVRLRQGRRRGLLAAGKGADRKEGYAWIDEFGEVREPRG
ncbi:hypothetical protein FHR81_003565 [Actinoalloteichus hoggarensis]|uniref:Uncharacterized protein n=1 Tax=Actinoalloteichus hoggarensis TaxID=1470176 RepID=A0A221WAV1_9PSEU|nr:hypothetical protein AHOG_26510 [Actinoalloteichus hoggarensis]MBB5922508.1 hypothetical protein [Actinoalloteichus hoggarensis]